MMRRSLPGVCRGPLLVLAAVLVALGAPVHVADSPVLGPLPAGAQVVPPGVVTPDDYGRFESLAFQALSPNGDRLAYGIRRVDEEEELRIVELASDSVLAVVPWGRSPVFSPTGRHLVWTRAVSPEERERSDGPARQGAGMLDLETGTEQSWNEVRAGRFDGEGRFLALHGYAPDEPRGKGADLRVLDLSSGTVTSFGNVDTFAWSEAGSLLAMAIATGSDEGNGVQLYHAEDGRLRALDVSGSAYRHVRWREGAADLAVLRSEEPQGADSTAHAVLAWRGLGGSADGGARSSAAAFDGPLVLGPHPEGVADTLRVVGLRAPGWSDDGRRLSFGLRPWEGGEEEPEAPPARDREDDPDAEEGTDPGELADPGERPGGGSPRERRGSGNDDGELADLQLWHSSDVLIFPQQRSRAAADARRTLLAVWTLVEQGGDGPGSGAGTVVQVGIDLAENASLTDDWRFAVERSSGPYPWGTMFGRPYHDVWVTDVASGERTRLMEEVRWSWTSPGGRFLLSFDGEHYRARDLHAGTEAVLTEGLETDFANLDYDTPTDLQPPHGVGGWLEDDAAVLLYDRHDVWRVAPDGSGGERLTLGAEEEVIHRVMRIDGGFGADAHDPAEPLWVSLREEPTERRGFARVWLRETTDGGGGDAALVERLLLEDAWPRSLVRADSADVYLYRSEARDVPPDLWVAGPDLSDARRVTRTNPFLDEFAWTRSELLHFESEAGIPLKAVLLYPADHDPSREYPMIVYTYERLSQGMHSFQVPSERSYYNYTVWTQEGYFVLLPDIVYRARDPGPSALEAVRPAVRTVVDRGLVDPESVGLIGHSWGGYQATYLPTRTDIFAASVAGAPLTDFKSFMGQIHWSGGNPEVTHWETGQARMEVPYWEDVEAHLRNSPAHFVHEMDTPLLMAFGDDDGVVEWWQGTLFYNFARRAGKDMVLIVYEGEGHGFGREPNQIDYHRRILEWFGHYLKGEPAPAWITDGIPYGELDEERRRIREAGRE
jgi:dipeptidyl aminopeptidase/acylaminoacyl peptidase